jgi:hypothetical protein
MEVMGSPRAGAPRQGFPPLAFPWDRFSGKLFCLVPSYPIPAFVSLMAVKWTVVAAREPDVETADKLSKPASPEAPVMVGRRFG